MIHAGIRGRCPFYRVIQLEMLDSRVGAEGWIEAWLHYCYSCTADISPPLFPLSPLDFKLGIASSTAASDKRVSEVIANRPSTATSRQANGWPLRAMANTATTAARH